MKTTKFRILEFCYITMAYTFLTVMVCGAFFVLLVPIYQRITFTTFSELPIPHLVTIVATAIGFCTIRKLMFSTLPKAYRDSISAYTGSDYPQSFLAADIIGFLVLCCPFLFCLIFAVDNEESAHLITQIYNTFVTICCLSSIILTILMLLVIWFTKHYRRIEPSPKNDISLRDR